jgi:hypothetical protein
VTVSSVTMWPSASCRSLIGIPIDMIAVDCPRRRGQCRWAALPSETYLRRLNETRVSCRARS